MFTYHSPADFLTLARIMPLVDVRSPGEFYQGHVPGAINVPLFDDDQRAAVGTCYARQGHEAALMLGLELVGAKLLALVQQAMNVSRGEQPKEPLVNPSVNLLAEPAASAKLAKSAKSTPASRPTVALYCHRGGMRSRSVGLLLDLAGVETHMVIGGYKACRTHLRRAWEAENPPILVLGGMTGTGKTAILHELARLGGQVVDLEGLAHHRGSAFGGLGPQPRNEHFENRLGCAWLGLSPQRPVWLENESLHVGSVTLPVTLFERLRHAPLVLVSLPLHVRVQRIVHDYAHLDDAALVDNLTRLKKRLGGERFKTAMEALQRHDRLAVVNVLLDYYDRGYADPADTRLRDPAFALALTHDDPTAAALQLLEFEKTYKSE